MFKIMAPDHERAIMLASDRVTELYDETYDNYRVVLLSDFNELPIISRWEDTEAADEDVVDEVTIEHIAVLGYN